MKKKKEEVTKKIIVSDNTLTPEDTGGDTDFLTSRFISITSLSAGLGNLRTINVNGLGFGNSPADLAKIFLEFIGTYSAQYTEKDLRTMTDLILDIHQRKK